MQQLALLQGHFCLPPPPHFFRHRAAANHLAIRRALEAAGVEFIDENGRGPGVRLPSKGKKPQK
jgi:hypothetical protein